MAVTLMEEEWDLLASFLPEGWRDLARDTGAMRRARGGITSPEVLLQVLLRAVDATTVEEPGATGTDWRVHYSISLPEMRCDFYEVTDDKGGETYKRIPVQEGEITLGDRGYCHREGAAYVLRQQGDVIVGHNRTRLPLLAA